MTRRNAVLLIMVITLFAGLYTGWPFFYTLTYMLALILLVSFGWVWASLRYTDFSRSTRTRRTQVGRPLEERFRIVNTSRIPKLPLEVLDYSDVPAHQASHVVSGLWSNQGTQWRVQTICRQRGRYQLGPMLLRTSDPFGLFSLEKSVEMTTNVVIFPMAVPMTHFALPAGVLSGGDALRRKTHFVTTNAAGVRDYAPGDSLNRIHWKSSARRGRLIVKEFELDPLADIWIVPDMSVYDQMAAEDVISGISANRLDALKMLELVKFELPATTEEYIVTIAATLTQFFLKGNRSVGMMAYGHTNEVVQPDKGLRQENKIFETLSVLRAEGAIPPENLLLTESRIFPRGATVIIITPTTKPEWAEAARQLRQRGLRVVTVLVNPASFGGRRSNEPLVADLKGREMGAFLINKGDDIGAVLSIG
ncbi:MAG: hypothetical protein ACI9EW_003114 [Cellvibrionaceae bacterium]|jgi:uncharacterized protein (DUF58 family)